MRANKLRELLKSNKPTLSTHIHTTWPSVVEAIGHTGLYDYVEFVGEYGPFDLHDLDNLARAADIYNMSMQLKVDQEPRGFLAQRAIGSGFHSILFADCRSAADVHECVRIVRAETPEDGGTYGVATRRFTYMGYGGGKQYVQALRDIVVAIMIEKPGTVDTLEECLSVKGVDMVQFGPADYAMSIGLAGQWGHPKVKEAERFVIETALRKGIAPGKSLLGVRSLRMCSSWTRIIPGKRRRMLNSRSIRLHFWRAGCSSGFTRAGMRPGPGRR